jgi:hypothetical protein
VRQAQVLLYEASSTNGERKIQSFQQKLTDDEGFYLFAHLSPGKYFVVVVTGVWYAQRPASEAQYPVFYSGNRGGARTSGTYPEQRGWSPLDVAYPTTFYPGVPEAGKATPIVLRGGEQFVANIPLEPVAALHIHVVTAENATERAPFQNFQLQSRPFDASHVSVPAALRPLASGQMEITGLVPGRYMVDFTHSGITRSGELEALSSGAATLEHVTSPMPLAAAVRFETEVAPTQQENLILYDPNLRRSYVGTVSAGGEVDFLVPVPPGAYTLSANGDGTEFLKAVSAAGATINGQTVQIDGTSPVYLNVTLARGLATINGLALRNNKPLAGAMILLVPSDVAHNQVLVRRDESDSNGTFTLWRVVPGKYMLLAIENGWDLEWMNPAVLKPYLFAAEIVQVEQNGKYDDIKVPVQ